MSSFVFRETLMTHLLLWENANVETANFALLFEYDEIEVQTDIFAFTATPLASGLEKSVGDGRGFQSGYVFP